MTDGAPVPAVGRAARLAVRRWFLWIALPTVLGTLAGMAAAAFPWGRDLLGILLAVSGLAWVLRIASDWFAERAGPQQGVVLLGSILLGLWLVLAVSPPAALRSLGFGPLLLTEERDPYARPPAGSGTPLESLQRPAQPIDLKDLVPTATPEPAPAQPPPPPPAAGGRATLTTTLTLSAATSAAGEGIVLIGKVRGDGRPIHGTLDFLVGDRVVSRQVLRVQGDTSQAEYRLVGLRPGLYALRVAYRGSHTYAPSESDQVPHRVAPR